MNRILVLINQYRSTSLGRKFISGVVWSFLGSALSKFFVLLGGILSARILGKEAFGQFGMVKSTISMFVILGSSGLGLTATKYISEYREQLEQKVFRIYLLTSRAATILGLFLVFLMFFGASFLAKDVLLSPKLKFPIQFGSVLLFFTIANSTQNGALVGLGKFRGIAINTFYGGLAEAIFMVLGAYWYGVVGAILGLGLGFVVVYALNFFSLRRGLELYRCNSNREALRMRDLRLLFTYTFPATLSSILVIPSFWLVRSFMVRSFGYIELASFEVAEQWKTIILFIPVAVSQVVLPLLSGMRDENGIAGVKGRFWRFLKINLLINFLVTLGLVICVLLLSPHILSFYGVEYQDTSTLILLSVAAIPISCSSVVGLSIASQAKMWTGLLFNMLWAVIFIGLSMLFFANGLGGVGMSLAILISYSIHAIAQLFYLNKVVAR
ncbi:oligosaccharide flippase family protein [Porphyromonas gingivalis]|uniref:Polysaccharide biosynthesis protein n=2 Tax=Porphyromonas gingivalis TaxID=837 RepID=S5S0C3_PORGN|nr:oligosaccharide flippase family protein [Porphyromonas gingivalis]EOA10197.1 polysaccharide biosynthesis protein [Porphyromonas gingivalis JCVI SC001]AGS13680.1 polysaccharide biosynthesis protein [Porphyromonas gingivalis]AGS13688.1 polysaccharide biosynthesis protein [Porphyromonas gingivalis]ATS02447.1 polysaccharide biosynthesis protein [Porphyromonas gingivalis]ETA26496.1 hypothetical protein SJDPG2_01560 [Porphyromonas gingivalis SJD2]